MKRHLLSSVINVGLVVLLGASPAFAGLKIRLVSLPGIEPIGVGAVSACVINITAPRLHEGLEIFVGFGPHLGELAREANPVMSTHINPGTRKLISALDALAIAEIVSANKPNLNGPLPPPF